MNQKRVVLLLLLLSCLWVSVASGFTTTPRVGGSKSSQSFSWQMHSTNQKKTTGGDAFVSSFFRASECDDLNTPPSLNIVLRSLARLPSGSDVRGKFVDHSRVGSIANVAHAIGKADRTGVPPLTPFAAQCIGYGFAKMIQQQQQQQDDAATAGRLVQVCVGRDPREHGTVLCDAFSRGVQSVEGFRVVYTGLATTPSLSAFCRSNLCDAGVMVTASHLPPDRNGFKFFSQTDGGFTAPMVRTMMHHAQDHARYWYDAGIIPPTSGKEAVYCAEWVDYMPHYSATIKEAILRETNSQTEQDQPLEGLKIVLNSGNGSGGFFHEVLESLGADVSNSLHLDADPAFPAGVPNPEYAPMIEETTRACQKAKADLGIMLDTDADRCGFVVPNDQGVYEPLNRNRLIALLGVVFAESSPGCTFVTDSVTSEGLETFLQDTLGLQHVRYLKGYANVIGKAKELTTSGVADAQVAIETSGHCAMKENGYLDDGTYTAVKVIGWLARHPQKGLLDWIAGMKELPVIQELRMNVKDGSLETTGVVFDFCALEIVEQLHRDDWAVDTENLEGVRVRTGNGGFFMLRKSLHDPIISMQIEGTSTEHVKECVIQPLVQLFRSEENIREMLDLSVLENYQ